MLVGMSPAELMTLDEMDLGEYTPLEAIHLPEDLPATLPSELLERRPDVRAAEAELMAATAAIGVAQAERLPRLNLTALLGTAATDTSDLFTGAAETWGLGSSVAGPLFDFGRGRAGVEAAEAMAAQSRARYQATVISAFNEVRDALSLYRTSSQRAQAIRAQVAAVERTSQLAELRYQEGFIGFIEVLDAQRSLLAAELALAEAVRDQLNATATLFKALGAAGRSRTRRRTTHATSPAEPGLAPGHPLHHMGQAGMAPTLDHRPLAFPGDDRSQAGEIRTQGGQVHQHGRIRWPAGAVVQLPWGVGFNDHHPAGPQPGRSGTVHLAA